MTSARKKIMLVDDNLTNLTAGKNALTDSYDVLPATSGEKMFKLMARARPDLILLDVEMPEMDGYAVIKILKSNSDTRDIPVIFLTAMTDHGSELEGLSLGAIDYITKPFSKPLLLKRIELHLLVEEQKRQLQDYNDNLQHMVLDKTRTIVELQQVLFEILAEVVEYRDDVTGGHIDRTRSYVRILLDELRRRNDYVGEMAGWDFDLVILSSQLHDIGKVAVRDQILLKPGKLTTEEFAEMKRHTDYGAKILAKIESGTRESKFIEHATVMALRHHERWDGTGYPGGLAGTDIPLQGRLMAVADVYDALISDRPYKSAMSHQEAARIIIESGGSHFDPKLVEAFRAVEGEFAKTTQTQGNEA